MKKQSTDILDKATDLAYQLKKEHFIKLFLWIITITWIFAFLFLLLFSVIPFDDGNFYGGLRLVEILDKDGVSTGQFGYIEQPVDSNGLYVLNMQRNSIVVWINVSLTSGWLTFLIFLSIFKNMVTPSQIKKTLRKSISFGYLRQDQCDRTIKDIDDNTGETERKRKRAMQHEEQEEDE